ncbi:ATP-binding protein [Streptomyces sp. 4F14]|uniref:ATP-binding protein n=1 Tax=Streptomyces sp. 4F14 TaxID=3394380 RepID=UPI003A874D4B
MRVTGERDTSAGGAVNPAGSSGVDPGDARDSGEFVAQLRRLKAGAGLSFRDIERRARQQGHSLPMSTVASALNRDTLPHGELTAVLLRALDLPEDEVARWLEVRRAMAEGAPAVRSGGGSVGAPCLLPPAQLPLVGRDEEIRVAGGFLKAAGGEAQSLIITGPAGVGKTSLAVYLGHRFIGEFPDGQLYADLGGFGTAPVHPRQILAVFLRALGVPGSTIPRDLEERVAMYRTLLARRRVLVVLDNVATSRAARCLLPNGLACRSVLTSRSMLADSGGTRLRLPHLRPADAVALLGHMAGGGRTAREAAVADRIVQECGCLPLAVWVIGARLASRPHMPLEDMARALADERSKLDEFTVGDVALRASIELSYQHLGASARRVLRLMSLCGGADLASWAVAALLDTDLAGAGLPLDQLLELHLVEVRATPGGGARYRMHDMVAAFAREAARREETEEDRERALDRVLSAALQLAQSADVELSADFRGITRHHHPPRWTLPGEDTRRLLSDPLRWFDEEAEFLGRTVERMLPADATLAGSLAVSLTTFFQIRGHFDEWRHLQQRALAEAVAAGDRRTAVKLHRSLGELATIVDRYPEAVEHFRQALEPPEPAEPDYTASAMAGLAYVYRLVGQQSRALSCFERAAELARSADNVNCLTYALNGSGVICYERGDLAQAERLYGESRRLSRLVGYRPGESLALRSLGHVHRARGDIESAARCYAQAESLSVSVGDRLSATHARCWSGDALVRLGRPAEGRRLLAECLHVYRECANAWGEAATLLNLGNAQLAAGRPHIALRRASAAADIWRRLNAFYWLAQALDLMATAADLSGAGADAVRARAEAGSARSRLV